MAFAQFFYNIKIDSINNKVNFSEGAGPELTAIIPVGDYTPESFIVALKVSMDAVGGQAYTVTFNRSSRVITISSLSVFTLLSATGSSFSGIYEIMGYSIDTNKTGGITYSGEGSLGSVYVSQFALQDLVMPDQNKESVSASINESASGQVEVLTFGTIRFVEFSLKYITNLPMDNRVIRNNPNGFSEAVDFMTSVITKAPFEFMVDVNNPNNYFTLRVESTSGYSDGLGYKLTELVDRNLPNFYEINGIRCRVIE